MIFFHAPFYNPFNDPNNSTLPSSLYVYFSVHLVSSVAVTAVCQYELTAENISGLNDLNIVPLIKSN
jgi:hypothetical protein